MGQVVFFRVRLFERAHDAEGLQTRGVARRRFRLAVDEAPVEVFQQRPGQCRHGHDGEQPAHAAHVAIGQAAQGPCEQATTVDAEQQIAGDDVAVVPGSHRFQAGINIARAEHGQHRADRKQHAENGKCRRTEPERAADHELVPDGAHDPCIVSHYYGNSDCWNEGEKRGHTLAGKPRTAPLRKRPPCARGFAEMPE